MRNFLFSLALLPALLSLLPALAQQPDASGAVQSAEGRTASGPGLVVHIDGAIGPAISEHVRQALDQARERDAALVILRIDTPGGLDSAMRDMIKAILASPVPVIGYVAPAGARAASAGTYILYATHLAAMSPATNLGAATPIAIGGAPSLPGQDKPDAPASSDEQPAPSKAAPQDAAQRKQINDAVAYIRSLAERRGRNADWAERAVREGASLSAEKALADNVIDLIAGNQTDLLKALDGRTVVVSGVEQVLATADLPIETVETTWRTELLAIITNPTVAYMLMMVGIYGLLLEGYNPGALVPGVIGGICLLLALFAFQILPVNLAGLALIGLGLALIIAEAFAPSFGILGLGGIVGFVVGSIILMDSDVPGYAVPVGAIAAIATGAAALIATTVYLLMRARSTPVVTGREQMADARVEACDDFVTAGQAYAGAVYLAGEIWQATCAVPLAKGQAARVISQNGLYLEVEAIETERPVH